MKYILTILTLITTTLHAQIKVDAESYASATGVLKQYVDSGIIGMGVSKSYADYNIKVDKAGIYTFNIVAQNQEGSKSTIYIKLPTSSTILAEIDVPAGGWQTVTAQVKLSTTNKKIRFAFSGSCMINYFTYGMPTSDMDILKDQIKSLQSTLIDIKKSIDNSSIKFDASKFKMTADSTITTY